jgi:hypothetical protein
MLDAGALIEKRRAKGVFIDTNLLVLLLVGRVNPKRVENFKRTSGFTLQDFRLLESMVTWFGSPLIATPHILSQLSDLTDLPRQERGSIRDLLKALVETIEEQYDPAKQLVKHPLFKRFGLGDASIATVCQRNILVLTIDLQLQAALSYSGLDALNFNHVRPLNKRFPSFTL